MRTAAELLRRDEAPLRDVAARVGYESEAAFSKVFKRWTGSAPGAYRQGAQTSSTSPALAAAREPSVSASFSPALALALGAMACSPTR
jgi:AraC-like DNA-binding protein